MRIAVCQPRVPFARGAADILAERLTEELVRRDHEADLVTVPFSRGRGKTALTQALVWRLVDLEEIQGRPVDLVIGTAFPSYVVRHSNKVVWLVNLFREAAEPEGADQGRNGGTPGERASRRRVQQLNGVALGEAQRLFAASPQVADRVRESFGLEAAVLMPPPPDSTEQRSWDTVVEQLVS